MYYIKYFICCISINVSFIWKLHIVHFFPHNKKELWVSRLIYISFWFLRFNLSTFVNSGPFIFDYAVVVLLMVEVRTARSVLPDNFCVIMESCLIGNHTASAYFYMLILSLNYYHTGHMVMYILFFYCRNYVFQGIIYQCYTKTIL